MPLSWSPGPPLGTNGLFLCLGPMSDTLDATVSCMLTGVMKEIKTFVSDRSLRVGAREREAFPKHHIPETVQSISQRDGAPPRGAETSVAFCLVVTDGRSLPHPGTTIHHCTSKRALVVCAL